MVQSLNVVQNLCFQTDVSRDAKLMFSNERQSRCKTYVFRRMSVAMQNSCFWTDVRRKDGQEC